MRPSVLLPYAHAGFREVREVVFALPFGFEHEDYVQLLTDLATLPARARLGASRRVVSAPVL